MLTLMLTLCLALTGLMACDEEETTTDTEYKYTYQTDKYITNSSFTQDLSTKASNAYPVTSITGWDKSYHNSAVSSYVDSGAIDVSEESWNKLIEKLKADNDLINALTRQYKDEIIADTENDVTNESGVKTYIKENFDKYYFTREDALRSGATDKHIYMFNNYPQNEAYASTQTGTAQRLKSSSKVTLEKGKYAKISVWVKTLNIVERGDPSHHGANISLISTFNGTTIGEYRLSAIKVEDWTQYTVYVKADDHYDTTVTLALGLGFGSGANTKVKYYTQGSALFDGVTFEILDNVNNVNFENTTSLDYASEDIYYVVANQCASNYLFDLSMDLPGSFPSDFFTKVDIESAFPEANDDLFTTSNVTSSSGKITSKDIFHASSITSTKTTDSYKIELEKASASIKVASPDFTIGANEYKIVSFKLNTNLQKFGSEDITVDIYDVDGDFTEKRAAVATFDHNSDNELICNIVVKNNFDVDTRQFYMVIVVGPTNLTNVLYASDLSSGSVTISDLYVAGGDINDTDADDYAYYSLINATANGITDLYAGYTSSPTDKNQTTDNFSISQSPSDLGTILNYPSNPKSYEGVDSNHVYINEDGDGTKINLRSGKGIDGNFAGLVNSDYVENYKTNLAGIDLESAFGDLDKAIQPLMIYNTSANGGNSYGFIGEKKTINASSFAKVSVKVKVDSTAVAYVYLVDVTKTAKKVMTFDAFTSNVDDSVYQVGSIGSNTLELAIKIDSSTETDINGWVTVNFYVATGATAKSFRLEMWNGGRDGAKSSGLVLFDSITVASTSGFTESSKWSSSLYEDVSSPLYGVNFNEDAGTTDQLFAYTRQLTETEKQFNSEYPDKEVSYLTKYIWAKTDNLVYAIFNTIDPVEVDPYDSIEEEVDTESCSTETDPATFWMSFSTILLSVALVAALIMLVLKNVLRKHKANANDAKSHYKVQSRIKKDVKQPKKTAKKKVEETIKTEETDSYVYGEVEAFGEEASDSEDKPESSDDSPASTDDSSDSAK